MNADPKTITGDKDVESFSVDSVRAEFPILSEIVNGHPLVYVDNAATTQKPRAVIDCLQHYYTHENSNIHRGVHTLSENATAAYEQAREIVRRFVNAASTREIIFTRGTTESINLVAQSHARSNLGPGDEILITEIEHHSNIVPWQLVSEQTGATLRYVPMEEDGSIDLERFAQMLKPETQIVSIAHISNALGTVNPVQEMTRLAHNVDAIVIVDGAQASIHAALDMQTMDCDFYAFSGHKALGPTGTGVLYGREALLEAMPPWQGGGDMIKTVSFSGTEFNELPYKFEAGTPHIGGNIALGVALEYFESLDFSGLCEHEARLLDVATKRANNIPGLTIYGRAPHKASVLSFSIENVHPHDLGTLLDHQGVAIRTGHHCAMPVMQHFGLAGTARASFALYNTEQEIHQVFDAIEKVLPMLR